MDKTQLKKYWRTIKWLIFGLEIPILSILGLLIGKRLLGNNYFEGFLGMVTGAIIGLIAGSLILYLIAKRTYSKDKQIIMKSLNY